MKRQTLTTSDRPILLLSLAVAAASLAVFLVAPVRVSAGKQASLQPWLFNQVWLEAVVSIESAEGAAEPQAVGTGFLVRTARRHVVLVTAKHIVDGSSASKIRRLGYRLKTVDFSTTIVWDEYLTQQGLPGWFMSPTADLACRFLSWPQTVRLATLTDDGFFRAGSLEVGATVQVLGFSRGVRSNEYPEPVPQPGRISRTDADGTVAEALISPRLEGAPVVLSPDLHPGERLSSRMFYAEKVIGLVSSYDDSVPGRQAEAVSVVRDESLRPAHVVPIGRLSELMDSEPVQAVDRALP